MKIKGESYAYKDIEKRNAASDWNDDSSVSCKYFRIYANRTIDGYCHRVSGYGGKSGIYDHDLFLGGHDFVAAVDASGVQGKNQTIIIWLNGGIWSLSGGFGVIDRIYDAGIFTSGSGMCTFYLLVYRITGGSAACQGRT